MHRSVFVAGWRPGIGWTCAVAFMYHFVLYPIIQSGIAIASQYREVPFDVSQLPVLDIGPLMTVMMGMLGLGGLRTYEKLKGVTK